MEENFLFDAFTSDDVELVEPYFRSVENAQARVAVFLVRTGASAVLMKYISLYSWVCKRALRRRRHLQK